MSPCKPAGTLRIRVPRQNAQRLGPAVTAEVQTLARDEGILVQLPPPVQEQPNSAGPTSENASEWNSLLTTARADRGPQWDVGTQQFLVENESELYFDPTVLLEAAHRAKEAEREEAQNHSRSQQDFMMGPAPSMHQHHHQQQQQHHQHHQQQQYRHHMQQQYQSQPQQQGQGYPVGAYGSPMMGHAGTPVRSGSHGVYGGGTPGYGTPVHQGSFYGEGHGTPTPDVRRRVTRGMTEEFQGMYGM
ncbi:hypothetical protein BD410DRAFT_816706 [Rickenella mellea]|uniref:Uncharacterized protein n=1 Tax=Rickenella mellea TaxID=50990 RepID=A0A4Y7PNK1_9AGAM|nr:hypothetical protein BD410DRAFT_816706 [Rickenella mellea]